MKKYDTTHAFVLIVQKYLYKLVEIFSDCEDMEDIDGLHHLSSIMKTLSIVVLY